MEDDDIEELELPVKWEVEEVHTLMGSELLHTVPCWL